MNEALVAFYAGTGTDNRGRTLAWILAQNNSWWEHSHDAIQWVFPLPESSAYNANAPLLDDETIALFKKDARLRINVIDAFTRAMEFFWDGDPPHWFRPRDHNLLRLTRVLRFLTLCGFREQASELYGDLLGLVASHPDVVQQGTLDYWQGAVSSR